MDHSVWRQYKGAVCASFTSVADGIQLGASKVLQQCLTSDITIADICLLIRDSISLPYIPVLVHGDLLALGLRHEDYCLCLHVFQI